MATYPREGEPAGVAGQEGPPAPGGVLALGGQQPGADQAEGCGDRLDRAIAALLLAELDGVVEVHAVGHPDLALQIGRLEMAGSRIAPALPWLRRAAHDDETRVAAWLVLTVCAWRSGDAAEARRFAHAALSAAPAWAEPLHWLRRIESSGRAAA